MVVLALMVAVNLPVVGNCGEPVFGESILIKYFDQGGRAVDEKLVKLGEFSQHDFASGIQVFIPGQKYAFLRIDFTDATTEAGKVKNIWTFGEYAPASESTAFWGNTFFWRGRGGEVIEVRMETWGKIGIEYRSRPKKK